MGNYYAILGVAPHSDFTALRQAYYRRAKECHPDHHPGQPHKVEQFKRLVEAFNVVSDPVARATYDRCRQPVDWDTPLRNQARTTPVEEPPILDTWANDILEEMIVGNTIPRGTTLQTLLLDLERTERFMWLREAKNLFYNGHFDAARVRFEHYLRWSPVNLLALYYAGRCHLQRGRYRAAARRYAEAIRVAARRQPPLYCYRIRRELYWLRRKRLGWWSKWRSAWAPPADVEPLPPDEAMRRDVSRAMQHLLHQRTRCCQPMGTEPHHLTAAATRSKAPDT